jgi:hypothetical protein
VQKVNTPMLVPYLFNFDINFADCGAGIGRVTAELLLHYFQEVDLVEPSGASCINPVMCVVIHKSITINTLTFLNFSQNILS